MLTIAKLADQISARCSPSPSDRIVTNISTTIEDVKEGTAYFALSSLDAQGNFIHGSLLNGNIKIARAIRRGAAACIARKGTLSPVQLREWRDYLIVVDDVLTAFQRIASWHFVQHRVPLIGVTGSAGKTTTKDMIAHILETARARVISSTGNRNNGIGFPTELLRVRKDIHDVAVFELGMSSPSGEIHRLCSIAQPDIAVITNILPVHLERTITTDGVAKAKAEILRGISDERRMILNSDDPYIRERVRGKRPLWFGLGNTDVSASEISYSFDGTAKFLLRSPFGTCWVRTKLLGKHNVLNCLAAVGAACVYGVEFGDVVRGLETFEPSVCRGQVIRFPQGFTVIDDSYNSNPVSLEFAVDAATKITRKGRLIVVAGAMLELGPEAERLHYQTGKILAALGVEMVFGVGSLARSLVEGYVSTADRTSFLASNWEDATQELASRIRPGDVVLIKGSRTCNLNYMIEALQQRYLRL